jgi:hypothetical protein
MGGDAWPCVRARPGDDPWKNGQAIRRRPAARSVFGPPVDDAGVRAARPGVVEMNRRSRILDTA